MYSITYQPVHWLIVEPQCIYLRDWLVLSWLAGMDPVKTHELFLSLIYRTDFVTINILLSVIAILLLCCV